jgi:hypothetical protein
MQRLPRDPLVAAEVERRGEPRQSPAPRLVVRAFPIRNPEQFLRQHSADACAPLGSQRARFSEQGLLNRYRDVLLHEDYAISLHVKYVKLGFFRFGLELPFRWLSGVCAVGVDVVRGTDSAHFKAVHEMVEHPRHFHGHHVRLF